jgi:hypothetical protein
MKSGRECHNIVARDDRCYSSCISEEMKVAGRRYYKPRLESVGKNMPQTYVGMLMLLVIGLWCVKFDVISCIIAYAAFK